ncbi:MAG: RNA-protein complex protein Nop10 [Methanomassiliicoccaceae archaeon]|nr:RNA-protein complex protein Nop10 [Methanomassiliicoccaceae archaeon]
MSSSLRKCASCGKYSLESECPSCGSPAGNPAPAKFSPDDRYGDYRRKAIIEEYGENGKHRRL